MIEAVLGVDPGTVKAGFAVVGDGSGPALELGVEPIDDLTGRISDLNRRYRFRAIALGRGTHAQQIKQMLACFHIPIHLIDERETSLRARAAYFADHPPRGWRRFIPLGLQIPPCPIDDYAALLIARRYFEIEP